MKAEALRHRLGVDGLATEDDVDRLVSWAKLHVIEQPARGQRLRGLLCDDVIVLRAGLSRQWRGVVKAHEAGHRVLGHGGNLLYLDTPTWTPMKDRHERQAQAFALGFVVGAPFRIGFDEALVEAYEAGYPLEFLFSAVGAVLRR